MGELVSRDAAKAQLLAYTDRVDKTKTLSGMIERIVRDIPEVDAVPVEWFNKMIRVCGMQGEIGAVRALRWVLGAWKMTEDIWEDVNGGGTDQRAGEADL